MIIIPSSVLTRPADTTAYAQNDLVASSTTAGSIVVPSFHGFGPSIPFQLRKVRLYTNKTSGMASVTWTIDFWNAAPTFTNGDNGAYAVATGAASWLGSVTTTAMAQAGDGAYCDGAPVTGSEIAMNQVTDQIYWSLQMTYASGFTPASGQTFTLAPELVRP